MPDNYTFDNAHTFVGRELAVSDWADIDQDQVNRFGEVTRWTPPGHVDPEWAAREGPYGGTLVHGFFMISLITYFLDIAGVRPSGVAYTLNYGLDKVRVLQPVVVGDGVRLRDRISLLDVADRGEARRLFKTGHTIEIDGSDKPAVFAEYLNYVFAAKPA
ncbi:MAG: MaoC family dehydratase [Rhodospirillaceae bacterium]|nr:MaoC family dehydratase [Rhodospirillaceae bacterium]MBT4487038.1 MaoC family dehydratase [Rhodospirillaceae bacterium]MBT5191038.1 MaoC family dehydratase [Rhodospirillaceae bacterium]MBT5899022.1 MaoC family dehydratase [Rhodospirillaceae bacterium]MBT6426698.1 MaoC family dehydratase [Rhodospirillaceae bacterium]